MVSAVIHRIVEHQAATRPEAVAIVDRETTLTYRELNQRANRVARRLAESGLRRGALALVRMDRSAELAVVLLAVLKAGAAYAWAERGASQDEELSPGFCIASPGAGEARYRAVDLTRALVAAGAQPAPNLPVLVRGSDVACVLGDCHGAPHVLVPHASIAALSSRAPIRRGAWASAAGAFDLWLGLVAGATLTVGAPSESTAAA